MGINKPGLYAAFGTRRLFGTALGRYSQGPSASVREAIEQPTATICARFEQVRAEGDLTAAANPEGLTI